MLTLDGVSSRGHVWFRGLDITQSPHGDDKIFFLNETNDALIVCIVKAGQSNKFITLAPEEKQEFENMEGEYFISIVALPLTDENSSIGELLSQRIAWQRHFIEANTYNALLVVSKMKHGDTK